MTKKNIVYMMLLLSSVFLIASLYTNYKIYIQYKNSSGKTRALFGLAELLQYGYKPYLAIVPIIALLGSLYMSKHKDIMFITLLTSLISLIAIICSIFSLWRYFIM